jgi:hypothetical protein
MHYPIDAIPADAEFAGMAVSHTTMPCGFDFDALLEGLPNNLCPCAHWGFLLKGSVTVKFDDGSEEVIQAGEVYYLKPGHTATIEEDCASIDFSPITEWRQLSRHIAMKLQAT